MGKTLKRCLLHFAEFVALTLSFYFAQNLLEVTSNYRKVCGTISVMAGIFSAIELMFILLLVLSGRRSR